MQIVSFAKTSKEGSKKTGRMSKADGGAPSRAPMLGKRVTRKSASVREPYTTKFGSAAKEAKEN